MISLVEDRVEEVQQICRRHGVDRLDLFGSFERRDPPQLFDRYFGLKEDLEELFGRGVDLVMEGAAKKNPYFAESVAETRVLLYAA
jgi:uncharacterized protein